MSTTAHDTILANRARQLAKPRLVEDAAVAADMLDVLVFLIGDERLAMPLGSIVAIIRAAVVTPLPRAVAPVYGVTAWRGRPLTVLSVGAKAASHDADTRLIVLGDGRRAVVGLLADSVDETRLVARSQLSPVLAGARSGMSMGVTSDGVLVLDAEAMLNAARPEP
ncbi:MAG: chemotaxis protein CheW [Gemmatimonadaceae bacterium]